MERVWDSAVGRVELVAGWLCRWERREGMNAREKEAIAPVDGIGGLGVCWWLEMGMRGREEVDVPERKADVAIGAA